MGWTVGGGSGRGGKKRGWGEFDVSHSAYERRKDQQTVNVDRRQK